MKRNRAAVCAAVRTERLESRRLLSATYYVDNTAAAGGDGSATAPWDSVSDVNAWHFAPGDTVAFQGGETFPGGLTFGADDTGSAAAPVTITSYGSGRATISPGTGNGLLATNTAGLTVSNLNFVGTGQAPATSSGISFTNTLGGTGPAAKLNHVYIQGVSVSGFGNYGITVGGSGSSGKAGFNDVNISYADVHDNVVGGIETHGVFSATAPQNTPDGFANSNVYVGHCTVTNNTGYANSPNHSGDGIVLSDADFVTIERNVSSYNGAKNTHAGGPIGIWVWDVNAATIQYNESHHNQTAGTADGGGFDLDGGVTNSVVQYNYSHDNYGAGYGVYQFSGARSFHDDVVRYNVSQNDGRKNGYGAVDFWNAGGSNGISNIDVYNNTVFVSPVASSGGRTAPAQPEAIRFESGTTNVHVRNNVFQATGGLNVADVQAKQTGLSFQGNDYYSTGAAFSLKWSTKTYSDLASFRKSTGQETIGGVATGSSLSPNLSNAGGGGTIGNADLLYTLTAYRPAARPPATGGTSPGSNGGAVNLWTAFGMDPGRQDFYGAALPGTAPDAAAFRYDVGAWEYA